jgi:hypothetical protein
MVGRFVRCKCKRQCLHCSDRCPASSRCLHQSEYICEIFAQIPLNSSGEWSSQTLSVSYARIASEIDCLQCSFHLNSRHVNYADSVIAGHLSSLGYHTNTSISRTCDLNDWYQLHLCYRFTESIFRIMFCIQIINTSNPPFSPPRSNSVGEVPSKRELWTERPLSFHSSFDVSGQFWMLQTPVLSCSPRAVVSNVLFRGSSHCFPLGSGYFVQTLSFRYVHVNASFNNGMT